MRRKKEEGRRKKEEGRRKKEEGRRKKEEGRRKKEEGRGKKEEGERKKEEGRGKREEGFISCLRGNLIFTETCARPACKRIARTQMIADRSQRAVKVSFSTIITYEDL